MSTTKEFSVSDDVKELIAEIISKNGWEPISDVKYYPGTEVGDGYASKHVVVDIRREQGDFKLFVKYALNLKVSEGMPIGKFYWNETYFYDTVHPAYSKFLRAKNVENGFDYVPKCYGTSAKNVIALEDIRNRGFAMFDRKKAMDAKHISLALRTLADFHATSFAFKDQDGEGYEELIRNWDGDFIGEQKKDSVAMKMFLAMIQDGLDKFDKIRDKRILDKCDADALSSCVIDVMRNRDEKYAIFTQGDCWCNNIMFSYENGKKGDPIDIMLVDWQLLRPTSVVYDISYFFFTTASRESLIKLDFYLDVYYTQLRDRIKKLGSDPDVLYPSSVFEKEWKQYCKYGFAMAFMLLKFMLAGKDEVPVMDEIDFDQIGNGGEMERLFTKFDMEEEYVDRLRMLAEFMVDNDYL